MGFLGFMDIVVTVVDIYLSLMAYDTVIQGLSGCAW